MPVSKILVVDDSEVERLYLKKILLEAGYQVVTAASGKEALEKARSEKPDLVCLDIIMDEMDGFKACRALNNDESTRHIPVIVVSSKNQKVDRLWAQQQGARAYVTKPYTADDITEQVRKFH